VSFKRTRFDHKWVKTCETILDEIAVWRLGLRSTTATATKHSVNDSEMVKILRLRKTKMILPMQTARLIRHNYKVEGNVYEFEVLHPMITEQQYAI